jgi:putative membrane protein
MLVWFGITWVVSLSLEALSIKTGFPFGHYHYAEQDYTIIGVPVDIMLAYFAIAYTSWTVTQALIGLFGKKITGIQKFILPFTTSLVMCMFDLVTDPKDSTISQSWIWENGGDYFGVPILNFFGWVLTVYIFMQIFTFFISTKKIEQTVTNVTSKKRFWLQTSIVYLSCGLGIVMEGFTQINNIELYRTMGLVSVFTVVFVSYISLLNIKNTNELTN